MKVKNIDILNIFRCIQEVLHNQKAKEAAPESDKVVYAMMKSYNELEPIIKILGKKEAEYTQIAESAFKDSDKQIKQKTLTQDLEKFYEEEQDIRLHQISNENFAIIQKYISGPSTVALFNFLTKQPKEDIVKS